MKIEYFKTLFFTNCDKPRNFWDFKNGDTCVHRRILNVMLGVLPNLLMSKMADKFAYLGMLLKLQDCFRF